MGGCAKGNYKPFSLNALAAAKVPAVNFFPAPVAAERDDFWVAAPFDPCRGEMQVYESKTIQAAPTIDHCLILSKSL